MKKLPLLLESLHVGVIYEAYSDRYQLIAGYEGRPNTFDLVGLNGPIAGKIYSQYTFRQWMFEKGEENLHLWDPEPALSLEEML